VSSETARGRASLARGARAFLQKPIRAQELRAVVSRVLEEQRRRARRDELAVLIVGVGRLELGVPLDAVREVLPQPMTQVLPLGPDYLSEMIEYRGAPVLVLDLARRLDLSNDEALQERKLVVLHIDERWLAVSVDRVREPEEFLPADVLVQGQIGGAEHAPLDDVLAAFVKTTRGQIPVVEPKALLSAELLGRLSQVLTATS
jgi:chemotaxis signal transduction protein